MEFQRVVNAHSPQCIASDTARYLASEARTNAFFHEKTAVFLTLHREVTALRGSFDRDQTATFLKKNTVCDS